MSYQDFWRKLSKEEFEREACSPPNGEFTTATAERLIAERAERQERDAKRQAAEMRKPAPRLEGEMPPNPKQLFGDRKAPLHLIPAAPLVEMSLALRNGAAKYGPFNWRETPVEVNTYVAAIWRHLLAFKEGEDEAQDSGVHHLAHVMASCAIVIDALRHGTLIDNRRAGAASDALDYAELVISGKD